jgi:four helix bundle protein
MKQENVIVEKSYAFAIRIIKLYQYLCTQRREFVLSKQILRSGTSIGANVEEAIGGQTTKDFFMKLTIAYKEARETRYWIRLLTDTGYITPAESKSILGDADEILRILGSIQKTTRNLHLKNS